MDWYFGDLWLVRLLVQRAMAALYLVAFLVVLRQFRPLLGERGLSPVTGRLHLYDWRHTPSLFLWGYSDRRLALVAWCGIALAVFALLGLSEVGPIWLSLSTWLVLWALYLSIVNIGDRFYGFGWESMLLEAGFFTAFLGPQWLAPSIIPVLILRWMLFRTELGAGLIKLRHDRCWRDLTCLYYHYETQPLPNPTSWYFHRLPKWMHRNAVLFSHFVQLICPFGLFAPQPIAAVAGGLIVFHQLWLIVSGNYSWLNWLTVVLGMVSLNDALLAPVMPLTVPALAPRPTWFDALLYALAASTLFLSIKPALNLLSRDQLMNYSYNSLHLVNTYGAFGSVTKTRYEIIIEGTDATAITPETRWREYGFKAKPGDPQRRPPQVAPYHLRLDWMMWFLPFAVEVTEHGIIVRGYQRWFRRLITKLLENDAATLSLLGDNPFAGTAPHFVRALFYEYRYTDWHERKQTGAWWKRRLIDEYLPPTSLRGSES